MLRCIKQEGFTKSFMDPNQKKKFNEKFMKKDPPMWIAADFDCLNVPMRTVESMNRKLFVHKPIAIGYNIVKSPDYDIINSKSIWLQQLFW